MTRLIALWLLLGLACAAHAQTIVVSDKTTAEPLESVVILWEKESLFVVTDVFGQADLSLLNEADTLLFRSLGYEMMRLSYDEVQTNRFRVELTATNYPLDEVVVSSYKEEARQQTSLHIDPLLITATEQRGTFSLTDALATVPGVSQLSTGIGISKPVIRGLYGNRILVLFSGLRFDNQQWQDEHGLGLSDVGVSKVEIIKGPLSILYGTEAVGGVLNIIEEPAPLNGTSESDFQLNAHSNTFGGTVQAGFKAKANGNWYKLRVATSSHGDYSDGNNQRVLNSRFNSFSLKGSYGFQKRRWQSDNHYHFSYNKFGFVFSDVSYIADDENRWNRRMTGPHHNVILNMFTSVNTFQLNESVLKLNVGVQSNFRSEDEGGGELSLIMHLLKTQYALKWNKQLRENLQLVIANNTSVEHNTNFGKRKIVPDARMAETALSIYLKNNHKRVVLEYGVGGGMKYIKTLLTRTVNTDEKEIAPFQQFRSFINGMLGASFTPTPSWNFKLNVATGVRAPNLSELSANGLHEGIYTYEMGDPSMRNEQNVNGEFGVYLAKKQTQLSLTGFANYFNGYIYLNPTSEEWFGFPIYEFEQHNALIYGNEAVFALTPDFAKGIRLSASYAGLIGQLAGGEYLPYMPAQKVKPEIGFQRMFNKKITANCFANTDLVFQQSLVNTLEQKTSAYQLVNAGVGLTVKHGNADYTFSIAGNNLLNEAYYDHLSRFKNFGLLNIGRDISIYLKVKFLDTHKTKKHEKFQ